MLSDKMTVIDPYRDLSIVKVLYLLDDRNPKHRIRREVAASATSTSLPAPKHVGHIAMHRLHDIHWSK